MESISERIYDLAKEVDSQKVEQKCGQELEKNDKQCEPVVNEKEKVDLNALFDVEKSAIDEKLQTIGRSVDQYSVENEVNRQHRHVILRRIRMTRMSLLLALITLMFFVGLLITTVGAIYLRYSTNTNGIPEPYRGEHHLSAESLVDSHLIEPFIEPNGSLDDEFDETIDLSDVVFGSNQLNSLDTTVSPTLPNIATTAQTLVTQSSDDLNLIDNQLEELAPNLGWNRLLDRLRNSRNDFALQDIPPALDDVMKYFRRVFHLPRIQFDFDE